MDQIKKLWSLKGPLIAERNKIIDPIWKRWFPYYRKKLKEIDARLNDIDLQIDAFKKAKKSFKPSLKMPAEIIKALEEVKNLLCPKK